MSNKRKNVLVCLTDGRTCQTIYKIVPCLNDEEVDFYKHVLEIIKKLKNYDCGYDSLKILFETFSGILPKSILNDYAKSKISAKTDFDLISDYIYPFFDDIVGIEEGERFNRIVKYNVVTIDVLE